MNQAAYSKQVEAHGAYFAGNAATAADLYREAYALDPCPERAMDVGIALSHSGAFDEALYWLEHAYVGRPDSRNIRCAYGEALFRDGQWLKAWQHWFPLVENPFTGGGEEWNGQDLEGKEVLVVPAGGYGDIFMLARYIPEVGRRFNCNVSFAPTSDLVPVFLRQPSMLDENVNMKEARKWDIWMHLFHFMQLFQMTPETVLWNGPYIEPIPIVPSRTLRIGMKLGAGEKGDVFKFRSVPGPIGERFLNSLPSGIELIALTLSNGIIEDWRDTIALISACDLVISVDTSVLHLAGAMGKPAWAILGDFNDAKWGKSGDTTPWYPSMQIFRGEGHGYEHSLDQVTAALRVWLLHQKEN